MDEVPPKHGQKPKRRVNLSMREDLVEEAKRQNLNLSRVAEEALEEVLRKQRTERWREENREAIEAYNERIRKNGVWHKGLTPWH
jgi:antitoxin CcdA